MNKSIISKEEVKSYRNGGIFEHSPDYHPGHELTDIINPERTMPEEWHKLFKLNPRPPQPRHLGGIFPRIVKEQIGENGEIEITISIPQLRNALGSNPDLTDLEFMERVRTNDVYLHSLYRLFGFRNP